MVLVDTSVWADFFKRGASVPTLDALLRDDEAGTHPMVVAELACGSPPSPRTQTLADIVALPHIHLATLDEALQLLETERLYGQGLGIVDILLLASIRITPGTRLYTLDKRLHTAASRLGVAYGDTSR